jgi:hypothetical protein
MAWNDGISKMMNDYLESISDLGDEVFDVFKKTIDEAAQQYEQDIVPGIPSGETKGLAASFTVEKELKGSKWYGYKAEFKGENERGDPYQKIANVLNYGRPAGTSRSGRGYGAITGTHFITNAVSKLQGLSERINENIDNVLRERT